MAGLQTEIFSLNFALDFLLFQLSLIFFAPKNDEKADLDQNLECAALQRLVKI